MLQPMRTNRRGDVGSLVQVLEVTLSKDAEAKDEMTLSSRIIRQTVQTITYANRLPPTPLVQTRFHSSFAVSISFCQ